MKGVGSTSATPAKDKEVTMKETTTPPTELNIQTQSRRSFLKNAAATGAATAAGAATLGVPMVARAATTVLKMQGSWGAGDMIEVYAKQYVDIVNDMGKGAGLKIDYLSAGAVVKAFEVQDAVNKGILDMGHLVPAYWYGKNRAASLFGTGPDWGWDGHQLLSWFYTGGGREIYLDLLQKKLKLNVVGWFLMPMPTQPLGWFKFQPKTPNDLKNLKYRTVGLASNVMQEMGCKVTQLPGGEIIPAMEKGVIEAFEFNNPTSDRRFGAADVAKYYMMASYHQAAEALEIEINKTKWESLPKEHQAIIEHAVEAANSRNLWTAYPQYAQDLQELIHKDGVHVYRTSEPILKAQLDAWDRVVKKYSADVPEFKQVIEAQRAWAKNVAYYELLNRADAKIAYDHYFGKEQPLGF
jgi:TRAP-type mannitol/chloroaromatic compound transport system substrate-binding protein